MFSDCVVQQLLLLAVFIRNGNLVLFVWFGGRIIRMQADRKLVSPFVCRQLDVVHGHPCALSTEIDSVYSRGAGIT